MWRWVVTLRAPFVASVFLASLCALTSGCSELLGITNVTAAASDTGDSNGGAGGEMPDAAPVPMDDVAPVGDGPSVSDLVEVPTLHPLTECATASIDRLQQWLVASEATAMTMPAAGSILVKQGSGYAGNATFGAGKWHAIAVLIGNVLNTQVDLSASAGLTLTYSATAPFYLQMRAASNYSGGDHYLVQLPSTGGALQPVSVPLSAGRWTSLARLGTPQLPFADMVKQVRAFFFIGEVPNTLTFSGLLIDGYPPPCK